MSSAGILTQSWLTSPHLASSFSAGIAEIAAMGLHCPAIERSQVIDNFDAMELKPELLRGIYAVSRDSWLAQ